MQGGRQLLLALREKPESSGLFLDYDGTLSPIVTDPREAQPFAHAVELLRDLAERFNVVAVVSGRPGAFLSKRLEGAGRVRLFGLYGMEEVGPDGEVRVSAAAEGWRSVAAEVDQVARHGAPGGVFVEDKGLTVTLHFREAPQEEPWVLDFALGVFKRWGMVAQRGRMSVELRPPIESDKGTVVLSLAERLSGAACFGDDLGDLTAFAALDELAARGASVVRVAVVNAESPSEVAQAADLVLAGPDEVIEVLHWLLAG